MYGYEDYYDITPEQILQKISQQQIFEWILQELFDFSKRYKSPLREDKKPGCRFEQREDGTILFIDFGDIVTHRTCFGLVMAKYNVKLQQAIKIILSHFNLSTNTYEYEEVKEHTEYVNENQSSSTIITFDPTPLERKHKLYISKFLILPQQLTEDNVFSINTFYIQKSNYQRKTIKIYGLGFALDFIDAVKIYQPNSIDYKWITNCNEDHIGNFDNIELEGKELIITKSWKDHRVIRNLLFLKNVIYFQNEGMIPSMYILENLSKRFKLITIFFDNDDAGIKAAIKLQAIFNKIRIASCRIVYLPIGLPKDPSALVSKEGRTDTVKILKQIGL